MISPEIFRWGGVTVYSLFLLALAGMAGPLLVMLVFILPLAAVTFIEFWTRLGLYSSFAKAQESPSANRVQRILRRIPYLMTRFVVMILFFVQGVQIPEYPDFSQMLEDFRKTVGQIQRMLDRIQSDTDQLASPRYDVTQLVGGKSGKPLAIPTVGEISSNDPKDWTEIYTFYFDNTIDEKTREASNPMTGASDPFEAIIGLSTSKQAVMRASDLIGFRGVTWQLADVEDPGLVLGYKVELRFPNNQVLSWNTRHRISDKDDTYFMAAPDQANLQETCAPAASRRCASR